ncbi:MAG: DUF924 domain-containing protein [Desulfuromonas sp.]|nr:MAG: DUF924 domain-containing protein [Desulfuromonas sp.]
MTRHDDILMFWFGALEPDKPVSPERSRLWFGGLDETDQLIRDNFLDDVERAAAGEYDSWSGTARGRLALILLLDQFTRNIFRKTPQAFACDEKALSICQDGLGIAQDLDLSVIERAFFYLPLEHSEKIEIQRRSVAAFQQLIDAATPAQRQACESFHDYAVRHYEIIARFDRFPHRNKILGRRSTPDEIEFLKQPGSSF